MGPVWTKSVRVGDCKFVFLVFGLFSKPSISSSPLTLVDMEIMWHIS